MQDVLVIDRDAVAAALPMDVCMEAMADALLALSRGEAGMPLRTLMWLPDKSGLLGMMPAHYAKAGVMGIKVVSVMPGNHGTTYDAHQGAVLLFDTRNGRPLALVDASEITAIRTAAVSGVATRLLARDDAKDLAILGTGVQAATHLAAMLVARPIERVRVYSRSADHVRRFIERAADDHGVTVEPMADAREAVEGADLICTTTSAREPVLHGDWIAPGAHINAVGSSVRTARELDGAAVARSRLFVDRRESTLAEAGDFLLAMAEGLVDRDHIVAELGELLAGEAEGRRSADEITLFESLGLGVEDVAAAYHAWERLRDGTGGTVVRLGGKRV
jgi:ornithine cyclodeaminase